MLRDFPVAHQKYMLLYFWPLNTLRSGTNSCRSQLSEQAFERHFRMLCVVFNKVPTEVVKASAYLRQGLRPDGTDRFGIITRMKVVCALRQMAYVLPSGLSDDLFEISETTAAKCIEESCVAFIPVFEITYLCNPTAGDIERIEGRFRGVGFPGCVGPVDDAD